MTSRRWNEHAQWVKTIPGKGRFIDFRCLSCASCRIARELGVHIRTSYRWCWWLRNAALSYEMQRQLEGTVEADEFYHTAGNKG
jgi:hypothetical protein